MNKYLARYLTTIASMIMLLLLGKSANAMMFSEVAKTCPLCKTQFKASLAVSGTKTGVRLDYKPLGYIAAPAPVAVCPKCHFVLFNPDLKDTELKKLKRYVRTKEYQAWYKTRASYFLLAKLLSRLDADDLTLAFTYLRASWQEEHAKKHLEEDLKLSLFHIEAYLKGLPSDIKKRIKKEHDVLNAYRTAQILKGELLRRTKRFADAKSHFKAIQKQKAFKNSFQSNIIAIEIKLCDSKDSTPHKVPDSFTITARDINNKAVKNLGLKIISSVYSNAPTSNFGLTSVMMPDDFAPGKNIGLQIEQTNKSSDKWFFIDPWDGWIEVPKAGEHVKVILARRGDRTILKNNKALRAITTSILAMVNRQTIGPQLRLEKKEYKKILKDQAKRFGFRPKEIHLAIQNWMKRTKNSYDLGLGALYNQNYLQASEEFTKYLHSHTKQNSVIREEVVEATYFLGWSLYGQGKYKESVKNYIDSYKYRDLYKNPHPNDALLLNALGISYWKLGEWASALKHYQRAIEINITLGDRRGEADQLGNFGLIYCDFNKTQQLDYALNAFEKGFKICKEIGDPQCEANQLSNMAIAYRKMGETEKAADYLEKVSKIRQRYR